MATTVERARKRRAKREAFIERRGAPNTPTTIKRGYVEEETLPEQSRKHHRRYKNGKWEKRD